MVVSYKRHQKWWESEGGNTPLEMFRGAALEGVAIVRASVLLQQEGLCADSQFPSLAEACNGVVLWLDGEIALFLMSYHVLMFAFSECWACSWVLFGPGKQPLGKRAIGNGRKTGRVWKFDEQTAEELGKRLGWEGKSSSSQYASRIKSLLGYHTRAANLPNSRRLLGSLSGCDQGTAFDMDCLTDFQLRKLKLPLAVVLY